MDQQGHQQPPGKVSKTTTFRTARPRRLYEDVVSQVMELIAAGELPMGTRLPPERQLSSQINVSRNVLREAFRVLEERGLIVARPGDGRYVRAVSSIQIAPERPIDPVNLLELRTILDLLESRELIETQVVALACARITPSEVPRLRDAAKRVVTWRDNLEFHVVLASAAHNYMLERLVREQLELLHDVHQRQHYFSGDDSQRLLLEHHQIAESVIARDISAAQRLVRLHFDHTRQSLVGWSEMAFHQEPPV
ncbi:MAG: FadR family transcriptional regulator [Chloroflexia bacterium]|nr:FadR family transcriptional regulator [Chloroflexia bacterium]